MAVIFAEQLVKHFAPDIKAVDGIDLSVERGEIFGFLGANGSGKTTTVRMLTTLLRPTAGRAEVDGLDVVRSPGEVRKRIGVALQEVALDDLQTGRELMTLQARLYGIGGAQLMSRVQRLLQVVDLEDAADRAIKTYSGGMKRRLDLAASLVHEPSVVFLDEPTTGLDPISREAIWRYVQQLNVEDGVTFFLTTQYLEEADRLAGNVAIMDAGRIVAEGAPAALKASIGADAVTLQVKGGPDPLQRAAGVVRAFPGAQEVNLVEGSLVLYIADGSNAVAQLVLRLNAAGIGIGEIRIAQPTLDDVFLRKTGHHMEAQDQNPAPDSAATGGLR